MKLCMPSRLRVPRMAQEAQAAGQHAVVLLRARRLAQAERHDRQASHVVGAVARGARRDDAIGVLDDSHVVDEGQQVRGCVPAAASRADVHAPPVSAGRARPPRAAPRRSGAPPAGHASSAPTAVAVRRIRSSRSGSSSRSFTASARASRSSNGTSTPAPEREQVLGVEVRGRDHRAAGHDREGEGAGHDLLARAVRREVDRRWR